MGNCIRPDINTSLEPVKMQGPKNIIEFNEKNLLSRFEAVEGTLFLYRSIVLRYCLHIKTEVTRFIEKQQSTMASFSMKRQKMYEAILKEIEDHIAVLREAIYYVEANKKRKECLRALSVTYSLLEDIGDITQLEDSLSNKNKDIPSEVKETFESHFIKYKVDSEEVQESLELMDTHLNTIPLTHSVIIKRSDIKGFFPDEVATSCEVGC